MEANRIGSNKIPPINKVRIKSFLKKFSAPLNSDNELLNSLNKKLISPTQIEVSIPFFQSVNQLCNLKQKITGSGSLSNMKSAYKKFPIIRKSSDAK